MCGVEQEKSLKIKEGLASIFSQPSNEGEIFYNPAQVLNRDLSIVVLYAFAEELQKLSDLAYEKSKDTCSARQASKLSILEPLSATGLRSLRYAMELEHLVDSIVASDLNEFATHCIERNRQMNDVDASLLKVVHCDANKIMQLSRFFPMKTCLKLLTSTEDEPQPPSKQEDPSHPQFFNVIDLDPYGSVASFLDAAMSSVANGGLVCLTSTDMPVLCGNYPEVSFYKYGGTAIKAPYMHEMSLRLLVYAAMASAARCKRIVEPLLCCSIDFYVRCFLRVKTLPSGCKNNASQSSLVVQCVSCPNFELFPLGTHIRANEKHKYKAPCVVMKDGCEQCNETKFLMGGPFYSSSLYNKEFAKRCLAIINDETILPGLSMRPKLRGLLTAILTELDDIPLYYHLPSIMSSLKLETMKLKSLKYTLTTMGYRVSHFHRCPQSIKTDAPKTVLFDMIREWVKTHPRKSTSPCPFLDKEISTENVLLLPPPTSTITPRIPCWLPNPTQGWGPKKRAKVGQR